MDLFIKKTTELTDIEKKELLLCFVEVFEKDRSLDEMCNQYLNTPMGYCIHSYCMDNGRVVASHTAFPSYYWVGDKKTKIYITGDTMVRKDYRDGVVYMDVTTNLTSFMKQEGYSFSFGFPNENTYAVNKKTRQAVEMGRLDTYILPYRIGGIKSYLKWMNPLSKLFCKAWLLCNSLMAKDIISSPIIHKDDESYNRTRYKRMDGEYNCIVEKGYVFYYKIKTHEGVRTAFLIDVVGKSEKRFCDAARYIINKESDKFDLMVFVGHLPSNVRKIGFVKIPRKFEPKHFYMTGKSYDKSLDKNLLYDINNWDVNLSDYDVI